ncbi:MAG: hypothetical protein A2Z20_08050 [Bdellovibrionales bacterium RBG_16_40_8]|nr:MAG: hypothetical protein A2Z20_08050 [Bdellovibrionales bacterium RBG_16_40_8]
MLKRRTEDDTENPDRWVVSYADFITLMFAFFTVMFATSSQDAEKARQFENSIRQYLIKFGAMGESGDKVNQGVEHNTPIEQPLKIFPQGSQETQRVQKKIETYLQGSLTSKQINTLIRDITPDTYGVRLTLAGDILFENESVELRSSALPILDKIADIIKSTKRSVIVEGHAGEISTKNSTFPTAWELSSLQAAKVLRYFSKFHKIDANKLAVMAYGDQRPLPPYNNRIDLLIVTEDLPF